MLRALSVLCLLPLLLLAGPASALDQGAEDGDLQIRRRPPEARRRQAQDLPRQLHVQPQRQARRHEAARQEAGGEENNGQKNNGQKKTTTKKPAMAKPAATAPATLPPPDATPAPKQ